MCYFSFITIYTLVLTQTSYLSAQWHKMPGNSLREYTFPLILGSIQERVGKTKVAATNCDRLQQEVRNYQGIIFLRKHPLSNCTVLNFCHLKSIVIAPQRAETQDVRRTNKSNTTTSRKYFFVFFKYILTMNP